MGKFLIALLALRDNGLIVYSFFTNRKLVEKNGASVGVG
jgi:hypothetical protein